MLPPIGLHTDLFHDAGDPHVDSRNAVKRQHGLGTPVGAVNVRMISKSSIFDSFQAIDLADKTGCSYYLS